LVFASQQRTDVYGRTRILSTKEKEEEKGKEARPQNVLENTGIGVDVAVQE